MRQSRFRFTDNEAEFDDIYEGDVEDESIFDDEDYEWDYEIDVDPGDEE